MTTLFGFGIKKPESESDLSQSSEEPVQVGDYIKALKIDDMDLIHGNREGIFFTMASKQKIIYSNQNSFYET